jgi:hypothetical protein
MHLMELADDFRLKPKMLYAVAYRPIRRRQTERIQVWPAELRVGQRLPVLPLALDKGLCLRLDLEAT